MKILSFIFISIVLGITASCSYAQNLVPNYSFEVYDTCPFSAGQIYYSPPWTDPSNSSSDYFNSCASPGADGVPINGFGKENAKDGNAYAGFVMFAGPSGLNAREYIQVPLTSPLVADTCYSLICYVSIADNYKYSITNIGAYFSSSAVSTCYTCLMPYTPQINYYDASGIADTSGWYKVEAIFRAQGGEQYITIGNYKSDAAATPIIVNSGGGDFAYYYIDSVSLVKVSCPIDIGIGENQKEKPFKLFPNPNNGNMSFEYQLKANDNAEMQIYDITGKLIKSYQLNSIATQTNIDTELLNCGIYFYTIILNNQLVQSDKLVIIKD
ncbi:MAG: T9SS type A sorting domain-containing protein [Bacteroidetes bacterium]|nr:T9SS type A sorting domain-containing protein [Bacteroidota bacterium]